MTRVCKRMLMQLKGRAAACLKPETTEALTRFIGTNRKLFDRLDADMALCHGDFNLWNIIVSDERIYCIDFEYACADSVYRDIGHLFRRKSPGIQELIGDDVYRAFADGYNSVSEKPLPSDWLRLARLCDIYAMLCLLENDSFPREWVADIEADILTAVSE